MKAKLLFFVMLFAFTLSVNAQEWGIKGGVNFANMSFTVDQFDVSPKSITGFHLGLVSDFKLQESLHFNTGLLYTLKGTKGEMEGVSGSIKINYLEIPLNFAYKFPINETSDFFIQAGPYLAYALNGKEKGGGETTDLEFGTDNWKRIDFGLGFGAGVEFGPIVTSLNYQLGLANLADDPDVKAKNKVFQISVAYMFGKKEK